MAWDVDLVLVAENAPTHFDDPSLISEVVSSRCGGDCGDATTATDAGVVRPGDTGGFGEAEASTRVTRAVPFCLHLCSLLNFLWGEEEKERGE